jgi:hypothetical protein
LIGGAAYDSDPLDTYLRKTYDVELIAPHKSNRKRITQDGRPFRRYRRPGEWTDPLPGCIGFVGW